MKNFCLFIILSFIVFTGYSQPSKNKHWHLIWGDNFDSLNTNIWRVLNNFDHYSGNKPNGEPQVYTSRAKNVFINNGNLVIRLRKEDTLYSCPPQALNKYGCSRQDRYPDSLYKYTSGWIETKKNYYFRYGYVEAKIKLPLGKGYWTAFWLAKGKKIKTANAAEIDIFEMTGNNSNIMGTDIHLYYCNKTIPCKKNYQQKCPKENPVIRCYNKKLKINDYRQWHTYGLEWTPTIIKWYIDGYVVRKLINPGIIDPVRIILNFAITPWSLPDNTTNFPSDMLVDYVRVWQPDKKYIQKYYYHITVESKLNSLKNIKIYRQLQTLQTPYFSF